MAHNKNPLTRQYGSGVMLVSLGESDRSQKFARVAAFVS